MTSRIRKWAMDYYKTSLNPFITCAICGHSIDHVSKREDERAMREHYRAAHNSARAEDDPTANRYFD